MSAIIVRRSIFLAMGRQHSHEVFMQELIEYLPKIAGSTSQQVKSSARSPSKNSMLGSRIAMVHHVQLTAMPLVVNGEQDVTRVSASKQQNMGRFLGRERVTRVDR